MRHVEALFEDALVGHAARAKRSASGEHHRLGAAQEEERVAQERRTASSSRAHGLLAEHARLRPSTPAGGSLSTWRTTKRGACARASASIAPRKMTSPSPRLP